MYRKILLAMAVILTANLLHSQQVVPATGLRPLSEVEQLILPQQDNKALLDAEIAARKPGRAEHFATRIDVNINPASHGEWEILPNHQAIWRMRLLSQDAKSLNLGFTKYIMPAGGSLILYSPNKKYQQGPFSLADNEDHQQLWTPILPGDEMVLEVQLPESKISDLRLELKYVHHDFVGFGPHNAASGSCNLDVICGAADGFGIVDDYRDIIQSAAAYSIGGTATCSGALINNARNDCTPYFLTANHCGIGNGNAASVVVYWNYQNSTCRQPNSSQSGSGGDGTLNQFNSGSIFRASYQESDFCLIELDDPLDAAYNPFLAGWNRANVLADTMICIHHPGVEEKRISFDFDQNSYDSWFGNIDSTHVQVDDWDIGTTEGGSSGSPLFDQDKRIIGQLHGGGAACGNNLEDVFGWVNKSWEGGGSANSRLKDWLDPDNVGLQFIDGKSCAYVVTANPAMASVCNSQSDSTSVAIGANSGFAGPVSLSAGNVPAGASLAFASNPINPGASTTLDITNLGSVSPGVYSIWVTGTDGFASDSTEIVLTVNAAAPVAASLNLPADAAVNVSTLPSLQWTAIPGSSYDIEIATDLAFTNIISSTSGLSQNSFVPTALTGSTTYYWRVGASNSCGNGPVSPAFSFTTANINCVNLISTSVPVTITSQSPNVQTATINYPNSGAISDIDVIAISGTHTWISDLTFTLISPQGTQVVLIDQACDDEDDFSIGFDDQASGTPPCSYNDGQTYPPLSPLSAFNGENPQGTWTLEIEDNFFDDGGSLDNFELQICGSIPPTAIGDPLPVEQLSIYPNPSQGQIKLSFPQNTWENGLIEVLSVEGKIMQINSWKAGVSDLDLDVSHLSNGLYFIRYSNSSQQIQKKLILVQ